MTLLAIVGPTASGKTAAGLAVAVAFASKASTLPLLPVGWLAAVWLPGGRRITAVGATRSTLLYAAGFLSLDRKSTRLNSSHT